MFQPTWPSSGETHYLRDTWQEISYIKYVSFYKNVKMLIPPPPPSILCIDALPEDGKVGRNFFAKHTSL